MEMDQGKVFIGGISWDTNEDRLKTYFGEYGEVVEALIIRDRATGRARGFGFVGFAATAVAERVVKEKHIIDGRTVEAKKVVPKDNQNLISRSNSSSIQGSPRPGHTRKIFVGGLASTVTDSDFKKYFDQFGTIMDVVVMYDARRAPAALACVCFPLSFSDLGFSNATHSLRNSHASRQP